MTRRALTAALAAFALRAQDSGEPGSLEGRITSDNGSPVEGAVVKAQHTVRQATHSTTSGPDGHYLLPKLPPGSYNLYVSRAGYCSMWIRQVLVHPGRKTTRDLTLALDSACRPGAKPGK